MYSVLDTYLFRVIVIFFHLAKGNSTGLGDMHLCSTSKDQCKRRGQGVALTRISYDARAKKSSTARDASP